MYDDMTDDLGVIIYDEAKRYNIANEKHHYHKGSCVLVLGEVVKGTTCQESLC